MHQLEIFFDDVQAETDAIEVSSVGFLDLLKGAEDSRHVARLDPDPGVGNREFDTLQVADIPDSQMNPAAGSEFKRVAYEVL